MTPLLLLAALAAPPSDTTRWIVLNHGRPAGEMVLVRDGSWLEARYHHVDRNRGPRLLTRWRLDARGEPVEGEAMPLGPDWRPQERTDHYRFDGDSVRWDRPGERPGSLPNAGSGFYRMNGAALYEDVLLARYLLARREHSARILPRGTARLDLAADTVLRAGAQQLRARLAVLHGRGANPRMMWLDGRGELMATGVAWFITVRPGLETLLPAFRLLELQYRERMADEMARRVVPAEARVVAFVGGDLFDSEQGRVLPGRTVVVRDGRFASVGPADSVAVPEGASVIDATGRTLVPGLYDMHAHLQAGSQTSTALWQLAAGVTAIRDLASDADVAVAHRDRAAANRIASPRLILGGFIEGPGRWAGPSEVIVRTEEEARAWVARYDSLGYRQIKLYNLVHPDLVPTIAAEARSRGMRLSGHVPRGLSVRAAVELGFDEINHAAFLFSTFFQDSLYVPAMRAYSAVAAAVAPRFDVDGADMSALIEFLRVNGTVVDGTFSIWVRGGGGVIGVPLDSETVNAGGRAYLRLARRLYEAGVTMVPGTDSNSPYALNGELEAYERAGLPVPFVLQMASIISARVMGEERDYGSIAPGKVADLVVVRGRPAENVRDLRNVERVMRAGLVYDPAELLEAAGLDVAARRR